MTGKNFAAIARPSTAVAEPGWARDERAVDAWIPMADGVRLGLDVGDAQLLARYERWRAADTFMVATATDVLTRLFGIPGKLPSAVRRLGMAGVLAALAGTTAWFGFVQAGFLADLTFPVLGWLIVLPALGGLPD